MNGEVSNIVIDVGSSSCKAGRAGDEAPIVVTPTLLGRPKNGCVVMPTVLSRDCFVGDISQKKRGILSLEYPVKHGIVTDWDGMERIYHHIFDAELRINPREHPVLLTEPPLNPTANGEKMIQTIFEKFQCPAFYMSIPAMLAMIASGRHAGVVIDSGEGLTHVVPIEGIYPITHAIRRMNIGGGELTHYLSRLLLQRGYNFTTSAELEIVREIKEKLSYVAGDYYKELTVSECSAELERTYTLPDGKVINIGRERFECAEALFDPSLMGIEHKGFAELIHESIMHCAIDLRRHYLCNVVLSGGNTMLQGIAGRVTSELKRLTYPGNLVQVINPPERKYSTWIGGSILASLSTFQSMWIDRKEYEEYGTSILHRKCPY